MFYEVLNGVQHIAIALDGLVAQYVRELNQDMGRTRKGISRSIQGIPRDVN